ncbi:hypothetical protein NQ318_019605 [Aromia moschata]|uniref:Uncharacterized protein n=1 Tax=Aromia moschata TaxID=1265417 RepID=A0AAV8Z5R4_9CUCU|nr:hypothetical protein NQ318_019605 [Aromia moschata]
MKVYLALRAAMKTSRTKSGITALLQNYSTQSKENPNNKAVNEAEKIVGYPTSFLSLRWLLNDEVANIALHLRKLIGSNHPLLSTARQGFNFEQTVADLGSHRVARLEAGGLKEEFSQIDRDVTAGILHSQRVLAEITEMIRTSNIIHKSILGVDSQHPDFADLHFGNKLSLLTGDYLLSTSFRELAGLKNHDVNELISTCLRDLTEEQFIEPRDKQNSPLPAPPLKEQKEVVIPDHLHNETVKMSEVLGNAKAEWTLRHLLGGANLLAKCCQGTLMLGEHPEAFQELGYLFGRNMALAWQAHRDRTHFEPYKTGPFSLVCGPVLFHVQHDPGYHSRIMEYAENDVDYYEIRRAVLSGPGLEKTKELQEEFSTRALEVLEKFPESEAKGALVNIINSL